MTFSVLSLKLIFFRRKQKAWTVTTVGRWDFPVASMMGWSSQQSSISLCAILRCSGRKIFGVSSYHVTQSLQCKGFLLLLALFLNYLQLTVACTFISVSIWRCYFVLSLLQISRCVFFRRLGDPISDNGARPLLLTQHLM